MWLSLLILILIVAITFYQAMQGLFSAMITLILTLVCLAFAFGSYEYVAVNYVAKWRPDFAHGIALIATFAVPLLVLRFIFDQLIKRGPLLPSAVDRAGGAFCGLFSALLLSGMFALGVQLLPFNYNFLGYARVDVPSKEKADGAKVDPEPPGLDAKEHNLLFSPDRFVVGTARMLSGGLFSGKHSMASETPDIVQAIGWTGSTSWEVSRYAAPNSVHLVKTDTVEYVYAHTPTVTRRGRGDTEAPAGDYETIKPKAGHYFRVIRIGLGQAARDRLKKTMFTLRQIRLVGQEGGRGDWVQYVPIAIQAREEGYQDRHVAKESTRWGLWHVVDDVYTTLSNTDEVEVVYELPDNFKPIYLEYKIGAVVPVSFDDDKTARAASEPAPPPPDTRMATAEAPDRETVPDSGRGGRVRGFTTRTSRSFFGEAMPMELKSYQQLKNVEIRRGALANGHLLGLTAEQESGTGQAVSRFDVPDDKRLLQLDVDRLQAKSLYGRAMNKAVTTVQNFLVQDAKGQQHQMIGKYCIATVNGEEVIEVQYFPEQAGTVGGLGPFNRINETTLEGDYQLVFLFLVDPGTRIVSFTTGGSAMRKDDLESENLVAPD